MSDLNKPDDTKRMDWLCSHSVEVRKPLMYGSHAMFHAQQDSEEWDLPHHTTLREQVDAAISEEETEDTDKPRYRLMRLKDCHPGTRFYFAYSRRPTAATLIWVSERKGKACWHTGHAFDLLAVRKYCADWTAVWAKV